MRENLNSEWPLASGSTDVPQPAAPYPTPEASQPAVVPDQAPINDDDFEAEDAPSELDDWKNMLRRDFEAWLSSVDEIPDPAAKDFEEDEAPDLYTFYEQFAAGNAEARKTNRRTAEAFSQWGQTLSRFDSDLRLLREQMARLPISKEGSLPRSWCLSLAEVLDRAQRLAAAFKSPPIKSWWTGIDPWRKAWERQRQGFEILVSHLEESLTKAGMKRLNALSQPFDPTTMAAVATEQDSKLPFHTVVEEVAPGYMLHGELLRVAQVKVSINKSSMPQRTLTS